MITMIIFAIGVLMFIFGLTFAVASYGSDNKISGLCFIIFVIGILVSVSSIATVSEEITTKEYNIWYTDAPFGNYWVHSYGGGNFIAFRMNSQLQESYTIKYFSGKELITKIYDVDDIRVFFLDTNETMYYQTSHKIGYNIFGQKIFLELLDTKLYIPNPDLYKADGAK